MDDINLLSSAAKDEKDDDAKKIRQDDLTLHVPKVEPAEKPSAAGGNFLSQLIDAEKAAAVTPEKLFSQKIEPIPSAPPKPAPKPVEIAPLRVPPPAPRAASAPPTPPPPKTPPPPPKPGPEEKGSGTLRVSLITANGGAGLSDLVLRRKLRIFGLIVCLGLAGNAFLYGGLAFAKAAVQKRNDAAEKAVQDIDAKIAAREAELQPVRDFQSLSKAAARVLDAHAHWTEVLKLLEERALPDVQFGSLAGAETGTLSFEIIARDYTTLAKQIVAFRQDPRVKSVTVGTASADADENGLLKGVHSTMSILIDPSIFRFNPKTAAAVSSASAT